MLKRDPKYRPRPKPKPRPSGVFHAITQHGINAGPALRTQQKQVRARVRKVEQDAVVNRHIAPRVQTARYPTLKHYTPAQRHEIQRGNRSILRTQSQQTGRSVASLARDARENGDRTTRQQANKYTGAERTGAAQRREALARLYLKNTRGTLSEIPSTASRHDLIGFGRTLEQRSAAGHAEASDRPESHLLPSAKQLAGFAVRGGVIGAPVHLLANLARATTDNWSAVAHSSIRSAKEDIAGLPQGLKMSVTDPAGAIKSMGADYVKRYGTAAVDPKKFRKSVQNDTGLTPYLLDASAAAGGSGEILGALARRGILGEGLQKVATAPRPRLRVSGGEAGSVAQKPSTNLIAAGLQRRLDKARSKRFEKVAGAHGFTVDPNTNEITPKVAAVSEHPQSGEHLVSEGDTHKFNALRPGKDEVLPYYSVRNNPLTKKITGLTERNLGGSKSRQRLRLLVRSNKVETQARILINQLDDKEKLALPYALEHGIRSTSVGGRRLLNERKALHLASREGEHVLPGMNDNVAEIDRLTANMPEHFTRRLDEVANALRDMEVQISHEDPALTVDRATSRRYLPNAIVMDVMRAPDKEEFIARLHGLKDKLGKRQDITPEAIDDFVAQVQPLADFPPEERLAVAKEIQKGTNQAFGKAKRDRASAERQLAVTRGRIAEAERSGRPRVNEDVRKHNAKIQQFQANARRAQANGNPEVAKHWLDKAEKARAEAPKDPILTARTELAAAESERKRVNRILRAKERRAGRAEGAVPYQRKAKSRKIADRRQQLEDTLLDAQAKADEAEALRRHYEQQAQEALDGPSGVAGDDPHAGREYVAATKNADTYAKKVDHFNRRAELAQHKIDDLDPVDNLDLAAHRRANVAKREIDYGTADLKAAERGVADAKARLREAEQNAGRVPPSLRQREADHQAAYEKAQIEHEGAHVDRVIAAWVTSEVRRNKGRYVNTEDFVKQVDRRMEEYGLEAPAYWQSTPFHEQQFSLKAVGTGARAIADSKSYTGALLRRGRQSTDPEVFISGLLRNVKRQYSWRFTAQTIDKVAFEWSRGSHGQGLTIDELKAEMLRRHVDPRTVSFISPGRMHEREMATEGLERGAIQPSEVDAAAEDTPDIGGRDDPTSGVHSALTDNLKSWQQLQDEGRNLSSGETKAMAFNRYVAVDSDSAAELEAAMRPSSGKMRAFEVLWKQKPARIMLGLLNIPWLSFQIMSNGMLSGMAGALNPFDYVAAGRWWRTLSDAQKEAIEPYLGITHGHHHAVDAAHLGYAGANNRIVDAWHAFRSGVLEKKRLGGKIPKARQGVSLHDLNPLDAFFKMDEAQNNFFRRAVFYSQAKKAAYRDMGKSWDLMTRSQVPIMHILGKKTENFDAAMRDIIRSRDDIVQHAEHLNSFLGDYLTYTTAERNTLARATMFYGYLRFSLRLLFWTMPVEHPLMTDVMANLGQMGSDEVKRLLGVPANFDVPVSMLANMYFGTKNQLKDGKGGQVPVGRMNPFLNSITQAERPEQLVGMFSPMAQLLVDQAFHESTFTGRDWTISTRPAMQASRMPSNYYGSFLGFLHPGSARNRIALESLLSMAAPYRIAAQNGIPGVVKPEPYSKYADTTLWHPAARTYANKDTQKAVTEAGKQRAKEGGWSGILKDLMPVAAPQSTPASAIIQSELQKRQEMEAAAQRKGKPKKRRRKKSSGFGGGGGGFKAPKSGSGSGGGSFGSGSFGG